MSTSEDPAFRRIGFDRVYGHHVGGIPVTFGRVGRPRGESPVIYAAAVSEQDMRRGQCGYGTTEAEAAADLFRLMRPPSAGGERGL